MDRGDLTDEEWAVIGPLLPAERGRHARLAGDNRRFLNGMLYVLRVGVAPGAACSSIAAVGAALVLQSPVQEQDWFLRVAEQGQSLRDGQSLPSGEGAEIARDCGVRSFETVPGVGSDQTDAIRIQLTRGNNPALGCIVEQSRNAGLWIGVQLEPLGARK